jgi:5'(3')-deoxyribonucleotidase
MDDVLCDFNSAYARDLAANPGIKFPQSQYGFFERLAPIEGSILCVNALIKSEKYIPYVLTAPSTRNPFSYTEKRVWIEKHFGYSFVDRLIICSNKGLLKGDILIDDNVSGKGQEKFEGKLIHFGSKEFPDWKAVQMALGLPA